MSDLALILVGIAEEVDGGRVGIVVGVERNGGNNVVCEDVLEGAARNRQGRVEEAGSSLSIKARMCVSLDSSPTSP